MFENEISSSRFPVLLFIFQAFAAPSVTLILGLIATVMIERAFNGQKWENPIGYVVFGKWASRSAARFNPSFQEPLNLAGGGSGCLRRPCWP